MKIRYFMGPGHLSLDPRLGISSHLWPKNKPAIYMGPMGPGPMGPMGPWAHWAHGPIGPMGPMGPWAPWAPMGGLHFGPRWSENPMWDMMMAKKMMKKC